METPVDGDPDDSEITLGDTLPDTDNCVVDQIEFNDLQNQIEEILKTLNDRDRYIIELRLGLLDGEIHSLKETGTLVENVSTVRIAQIQYRTISNL